MKWQYETVTEKVKRLSTWHDWFAWHPVYQRGQAIWLKKIRRRCVFISIRLAYCWEYDFQEKIK